MANEDLLKDVSKPDPDDKDYFLVTITDLDFSKTYPLQFRWVYKNDKKPEEQEWSVVKNIITPGETLNSPQFLAGDFYSDGFNIIVKWSGLDNTGNAYSSNLDRVEIFIRGGQYGGTSVYSGRSFKSAGTDTFAVNTSDTYYVKLRAVSKRNGYSAFSTERAVTTVAPLTVDTQGPDNVSSSGMTISAGVDSSGAIGFNGYIDLGWSAVTGGGIRGYRIRFRTGTSNYSYVDSPGTGVTYRLRGLAVGATYEIGIATYDEFNNTSSSYTSFTSTAIGGTPFVGTNVNTTGYFSAGTSPNDFQFGYGIDPSNNSNTFAGTKRGIYLTSSNYWVIDSLQSAKFKVGGATSNYIYWNGSSLSIDGNLGVAGGTSIGGNIALTTTGASIYNGTLDGLGALTGTGFILNKDGLQFKYLGADKIKLEASTGKIYAYDAVITGTIDASTITGSTFQTDSATDGGVNRYIKISGSGSSDRIFFYTTGKTYPGYVAIRSDNVLDIVAPYTTTLTNRLSMDSGGNSILYGGATDSYIRIGTTTAYISKPTTIEGTLQVTESGPNASYNVKRIKATNTAATPTGGADGDIVLVWA